MRINIGNISFDAYRYASQRGFWHKVNRRKWSSTTYQYMKKYLDHEHSYVDVGAWIGPTVLFGCQLARHCHAIEPDPVALALLQKHICLNNFNNITVYDYAIADYNGEIKLGAPLLGDSATSLLFSQNAFTANCLTLEEFFVRNSITDCNFIKMDIEGGELPVLRQAKPFLKQLGIPICLAIHYNHHMNEHFSQYIDNWPQLRDHGMVEIANILDGCNIEVDGAKVSADTIRKGKRIVDVMVTF